MKEDPTLSFQLIEHGQGYGSIKQDWPIAEALTRRLKRVMLFVSKHVKDNGGYLFQCTPLDNYRPTGLKL